MIFKLWLILVDNVDY